MGGWSMCGKVDGVTAGQRGRLAGAVEELVPGEFHRRSGLGVADQAEHAGGRGQGQLSRKVVTAGA